MIYRTIEYDFDFTQGYGDKNVFKGIILELNTQNKITFVGDFPQAWYRSMVYILNRPEPGILNSSSVNHFFTDHGNNLYKEVYIYNNADGSMVYTEEYLALLPGGEYLPLYIPKEMSFSSWEDCEKFLNNDNDEGKELVLEIPSQDKPPKKDPPNPIIDYFKNLTDQDLILCQQDIAELKEFGVLRDGHVRKLIRDLKDKVGFSLGMDHFIYQVSAEGLKRYAELLKHKEV